MKTPAIIYLAIVLLSGFISAYRHGKPKTGNDSFWVWVISTVIVLPILYWEGFFN